MKNPFSWMRNKFYAAGYDAAESGRSHQRLQWGRQVGKDEDSMIGAHGRDQLRALDMTMNGR